MPALSLGDVTPLPPPGEEDDYDSDTFVAAEPPPNPHANLGVNSIASMLARAGKGRRSRKIEERGQNVVDEALENGERGGQSHGHHLVLKEAEEGFESGGRARTLASSRC